MKAATKPSLILASILAVVCAATGFAPSLAEPASQTFTGHYDWRDGGRDDLRVDFKADGNGQWVVRFHFEFDGRANTWKGTAKGGLEDGSELTGTALGGSRKWAWSATIEDGVMRGTHTELRSRNRTYETGTFVVNR